MFPCQLNVRERTVAEGQKFQKEVKNAVNDKFTKLNFKN